MKKDTPAYKRMDKVITNAFVELAQDTPFEKITVQMIADAALISRYTFYQHFYDKYEVAERIQEELYIKFLDLVKEEIPLIDSKKSNKKEHSQLINDAILQFQTRYTLQTQAIANIHTETIDYFKKIRDYLANNYRATFPEHTYVELEALMYANMATTITDYFKLNPQQKNHDEAITAAHTYVYLYAIGIHDKQKLNTERDRLMKSLLKTEG